MTSKSLLVLALATCLSLASRAEEAPNEEVEPVRSMWVTSGFWSYHQANRDYYNQKNTGVGVEASLSNNWAVAFGRYRNSVRQPSTYLQAVWTPDATQVRVGGLRFSACVAFGVINGYPDVRAGKFFPALLPIASVEYGRVGLSVTYIPTISGHVDGAVAIQLKAKAIDF